MVNTCYIMCASTCNARACWLSHPMHSIAPANRSALYCLPLQYLLKMWIIKGKTDDMYRSMWEQVSSQAQL